MSSRRRRATVPQPAAVPSPGIGPIAGVALVALVIAAYLPALGNRFVWDDDVYLTANPLLISLDGLRRIWFEPGATVQYYPLTFTSFWIEVHLWGLQPFGFHLVNVLLHALDTFLLWRLLVLLEVPGAWIAAAIFGVHPLHVESVAWVTERKNVLSAAFALGSALCFLRQRSHALGWYAASVLLFAAALLSKTATCFLPAALLLVLWWRKGQVTTGDLARLTPLGLLAASSAATTAWLELYHVGAIGAEWSGTAAERVLVAGRALWFYAGKLVWPRALAFNYPAWRVDASVWWQWLFPSAALAALATALLLRRRLGGGAIVALLYFGVALLPVLGFLDFYAMRYAYVADHFAYLPSIGLFALFAGAATTLAAKAGTAGRRALTAAAAVVLLLCVWRTQGLSRNYRDAETLWRATLAENPGSWMAHNNLGGLLSARGRLDEAIPHWQEALRLAPPLAEIHRNLGGAAQVQGRLEEAVREYREALRLDDRDTTAHNDLGVALASLGRADEATREYEAALALDPTLARAHNNVGLLLANAGRLEEAEAHFADAVRLAPEMGEAHNNYAIVLERAGRSQEALVEYEAVVRLAPTLPEARYNLAAALAKSGRTKEAAGQYREALRLRPQFEAAETALARLFGE